MQNIFKGMNRIVSNVLNLPKWAARTISIGILLLILSGLMYLIGVSEVFYVPVLIAGAVLASRIGFYIGGGLKKDLHEIGKDRKNG